MKKICEETLFECTGRKNDDNSTYVQSQKSEKKNRTLKKEIKISKIKNKIMEQTCEGNLFECTVRKDDDNKY